MSQLPVHYTDDLDWIRSLLEQIDALDEKEPFLSDGERERRANLCKTLGNITPAGKSPR